jgi:peptidoglycan/LPS O-acetylase OafA/YrhL
MSLALNAVTSEQVTLSSKPHFEVLDGLRGIAAYNVLLFHSFGGVWVTNGGLSVDLFFMLSGFVIAYSYRSRLTAGMSLGDFALRRFIRLYPMILFGLLLGVGVALMHNSANREHSYPGSHIAELTLLSMFLIPYLHHTEVAKGIYPLDIPLWSLFFELVANFAYALFARHMSKGILFPLTVTGLVVTVALGPLGGAWPSDFFLGFPRVTFGFFAGALLYELWAEERLPKISLGLLPLSIVIVAIANYPNYLGGPTFILVAAIFSAVVILGANAMPSARSVRICTFLGAISYPVYLTHHSLLYIITGVAKSLFPSPLQGGPYLVTVLAAMLITTCVSYASVRLYETPARKALGRRLLQRQPAFASRRYRLPSRRTAAGDVGR